MKIYPAILTGNSSLAQKQLKLASSFEDVQTVHIDVIDGQFVENVTITPSDLALMDMGELSCDIHLMTDEPLDFVYETIEFKNSLSVRSIIGQVERMSYQEDFIETVMSNSWRPGLAVDLFTPLEEITEKSWKSIDTLLILAIEAGWQGQSFHLGVMDKIKQALEIRNRYKKTFEIIIDGGIKAEHIKALEDLGIESVVVGSGLWESPDLQLAFTSFAG